MSRTVLVTGASRGIGAAMVAAFKARGDTVIGCARTPPARTDADRMVACDAADPVEVAALAAGLRRVDVLVNNAGIAGPNPMAPDAPDDVWHRTIAVNLTGPYLVTKALLPKVPDGGRIINVGSVLSLIGAADQVAYAAAKHGVVGLTRSLARLTAPRGITVNVICPGWVDTEMAHGRARDLGTSLADLGAGTPLGRAVGPEEVAALAVFLASDAAAAITGQVHVIDSGSLA